MTFTSIPDGAARHNPPSAAKPAGLETTRGLLDSAVSNPRSPREPGRGRGSRTPNHRIWRPTLCQLSYAPAAMTSERLLEDLGDDAGADGAAAFTDGEAQAFFHRDRGDQLDGDRHVVARHDHFLVLRQLDRAGDVGRAEVELRTVVVEERRVTAAFVLRQDVHLAREVRVRLDRTRLAQHLAALDVFALRAAQQDTDVVARLALVQQLAEHFHARAGRLLSRRDADDLDFLADLDHAALDPARHHRAATRD